MTSAITTGGCRTSNGISLALSLVFGLGQALIGSVVAWRMLIRGRWRRQRAVLLGAVGLWFVCSGIAELFVSGMEVARLLAGHPGATAFALWRGRADIALLAATVVVGTLLVGALLAGRVGSGGWRANRHGGTRDARQGGGARRQ